MNLSHRVGSANLVARVIMSTVRVLQFVPWYSGNTVTALTARRLFVLQRRGGLIPVEHSSCEDRFRVAVFFLAYRVVRIDDVYAVVDRA